MFTQLTKALQESTLPTINDVCKQANVSKSTVSRVLNNHPRVSPETKAKVLAAIEKLNYKPNASAQALASNRANSIGMIVGTLAGPFYSSLVSSAEETIRNNGLYLIATSGQHSTQGELDAVSFLESKQVEGLIIYSGHLTDDQLLDISKHYPATILLGHSIPEMADRCILLNDELGGYLATKHLIDHGHTTIGCITGPLSQTVSRNRLQGYRNALEEAGIEYRAHLVVEATFDLKNNLAAPRKLLDRDNAISAIFCLNDHIALGVYDVLRERELAVGEDISVVGFDNSEFCNYLMPRLTSVNFPTTEMGETAALKALSIIKGTEFEQSTLLSPELVVRDSVKRAHGK